MMKSDQTCIERMKSDLQRQFHILLERNVSFKTPSLFFLVLCLLVTTDGAGANQCHEMELKEKVENSNVVVCASIQRKYMNSQSNGMYPCDLKVMLIFKGQGLITSNKLKLSNDMIHVEGFGNDHICNSNVHLNDTKLFFLNCDGKTTQLNSGILPVTMDNLQSTEAVSKSKYL